MQNNYRIQYKTFLKACEIFNHDRKKFTKYMTEDKRLSQGERNLLKVMYLIKRGDFTGSLELLENTTLQSDFLLAYKYYLAGLLYNNFCDPPKSVKSLQRSIQIFEKLGDNHFIFLPLKTAVITLGNMQEKKAMQKLFKRFEQVELTTKYRKAHYYFAKSYYLSVFNQIEESQAAIDHIYKHYQHELKNILSFVMVIKFMNHFMLQEFDHCAEVLEAYKKTKGYHIKSNYKFMATLLKHLFQDAPIYVYRKDFEETPELYYQIETIKALSTFEYAQAKNWWNKLQKHNPNLYSENFSYQGNYCLFSAALDKHLKIPHSEKTINWDEFKSLKNINLKLQYLLEHSPTPISKEDIVKYLWDEELDEKNFTRLKTTISRLRSKNQIEIEVINGHYSLKKVA